MSSISTIFAMRIMNRISGPVDRTYILYLYYFSWCIYVFKFRCWYVFVKISTHKYKCNACSTTGVILEGDSGKEITLRRLTSRFHWSKAKFKSPCNLVELPYHIRKCRYYVYWNLLYPLSILKVIFLKSNPLRFKKNFNNKK